ncbi:unnamed protein product, partial [marine sediment metagenome]
MVIGYLLTKYIAKAKISSAEITAKNIVENAEREA